MHSSTLASDISTYFKLEGQIQSVLILDIIEHEIVDDSEFPKRKRTSKYSGIIEAAAKLRKNKVVKVDANKMKIGSLRSLLQKQEGKYSIAGKDGFVYIRKK